MKKRIAILSLVAMFLSVTAFAQTQPATKTEKAKTETKCDKKADSKDAKCCQGKTAAECKKMTPAEKAKCEADCKKNAKAGDKCCKDKAKACDKKAETPKAAVKK